MGDTDKTHGTGSLADARADDPRPLILFDGVCNLCNSAVQWVIKRDAGRFVFSTLQSAAARRELEQVLSGDEIDALPDSIVLVDTEGVHTRSTAALRIARGVGFPWALLGAAIVVPRPIRNALYDLVARNRYARFGRRDTCMIPTRDLASRFLDADEARPDGEPRLDDDGIDAGS